MNKKRRGPSRKRRLVSSISIKNIKLGHPCYGDGETYISCYVCHKKLNIGTLAEHNRMGSRQSNTHSNIQCSECYDAVHGGISVRTLEEQEKFMKTTLYTDLVKKQNITDQRKRDGEIRDRSRKKIKELEEYKKPAKILNRYTAVKVFVPAEDG